MERPVHLPNRWQFGIGAKTTLLLQLQGKSLGVNYVGVTFLSLDSIDTTGLCYCLDRDQEAYERKQYKVSGMKCLEGNKTNWKHYFSAPIH